MFKQEIKPVKSFGFPKVNETNLSELLSTVTLNENHESILFNLERITLLNKVDIKPIWVGLYKKPLNDHYSNWQEGYESTDRFFEYKKEIQSYLQIIVGQNEGFQEMIDKVIASKDFYQLLDCITNILAMTSEINMKNSPKA